MHGLQYITDIKIFTKFIAFGILIDLMHCHCWCLCGFSLARSRGILLNTRWSFVVRTHQSCYFATAQPSRRPLLPKSWDTIDLTVR